MTKGPSEVLLQGTSWPTGRRLGTRICQIEDLVGGQDLLPTTVLKVTQNKGPLTFIKLFGCFLIII